MPSPVHPDIRIEKLEKALAVKNRELAEVRKSLDDLSRRLASIQSSVNQHSTSISRLASQRS